VRLLKRQCLGYLSTPIRNYGDVTTVTYSRPDHVGAEYEHEATSVNSDSSSPEITLPLTGRVGERSEPGWGGGAGGVCR